MKDGIQLCSWFSFCMKHLLSRMFTVKISKFTYLNYRCIYLHQLLRIFLSLLSTIYANVCLCKYYSISQITENINTYSLIIIKYLELKKKTSKVSNLYLKWFLKSKKYQWVSINRGIKYLFFYQWSSIYIRNLLYCY